ncbi:unnamed protein product [Notodromas monacha]|uniref:Thrombospondin-like N-terminal domain-containing protein n=1 Tax=Notodromas monacha TaxID=399045 RepID=A0A7R9BZR5_9CRUS|nr:unnamed protein product [Notodromas monacha]CAG0924665.1 unnamed protein product [Notodromas monacha]
MKKPLWLLTLFLVTSVCVLGQNPRFGFDDYNGVFGEVAGPCADYKPGEDDLQAFDFIRKFNLDVMEREHPGVTKVRGSNKIQSAYRLSKDADLNLPTRSIFPLGLPDKFSFIATFRQRKVSRVSWDIIRMVDMQGNPQFAVTLAPRDNAVQFSIMSIEGNLMTVSFPEIKTVKKLGLKSWICPLDPLMSMGEPLFQKLRVKETGQSW